MKQKLLTLPTFIVMKIFLLFCRKNHPWKGKKISLTNWALHSTELNDSFSWLFWLSFLCIVLFILNHLF